jgi:putative colanic acid biosynthesis glycosyltransferase
VKCSIVTIAFNNLAGLRHTYESVLSQSYGDYEWIVVDGGSTDGTLEFLQSSVKIPNFQFVSEPDSGIYNAMNKGLFRSTGDYVTFLNSGDCFANSNVLAEIAGALGKERPTVVYGDAIESDGSAQYYKAARKVSANRYVMFTHHQAIFYRTDIAQANPYDETYRFGGDWAFTTRIVRLPDTTSFRFPGAICIFERGGVSQTDKHRARINQEHWRTYREVGGLSLPVAATFWILKTQTNKIRSLAPGLYDFVRYRRK